MVKLVHVKKALRASLFTALLIAYSVMYLEPALNQYSKKDKTIAQKRENIAQPESPVLVLCPDPPFKKSFFEQFSEKKGPGAENFFWVSSAHWQMVENYNSTAMDVYMNMSYQLGSDWNISLITYDRYAFIMVCLLCIKHLFKIRHLHPLLGLTILAQYVYEFFSP